MPISNPSSMPSSKSSSTKSWIIHGLAAGVAAAVAFGVPAYLLSRRPGKFRSRVVGIIPARFASSRFQGKPLVHILGKPMIQRTWERAKMATSLDHVVVATDDDKIAECCKEFGADVVMTSESCRNGTERCNEALQKLGKQYDVVVNIQGDEPLIEPEIIDGVVKALQWKASYEPLSEFSRIRVYDIDTQGFTVSRKLKFSCNVKLWEQVPFGYLPGPVQLAAPDAVFSTAATSLKPEDAFDPNRVKCVDRKGQPSISIFTSSRDSGISKATTNSTSIGRRSRTAELLKVLENGYKMKVIKVDHECHGVDVPEDVEKIEHYMRERNLY
ncbi:hypothetical protein DH2020_033500 [Rehmannia glutinosa]|uniref:3-deoxy-manno-octulosonate cytidylyltransferase n=1 Tax=Rehmannia glutinosa TaxID=99300 RepID=A0ABR0VD18_REHGL